MQAPVLKPTLVKSWDEKRGRMVILLKNGDMPLRDVTVEDAYPSTIAGVLCFAKVGGIAPMAMAADGRIAWKVANLRPGEVKELVYTALTRETLRDPGMATEATGHGCGAAGFHGRCHAPDRDRGRAGSGGNAS